MFLVKGFGRVSQKPAFNSQRSGGTVYRVLQFLCIVFLPFRVKILYYIVLLSNKGLGDAEPLMLKMLNLVDSGLQARYIESRAGKPAKPKSPGPSRGESQDKGIGA